MPIISENTKKVLEKNLGASYEQLCGLDIQDEIVFVKERTGKNLKFIHDHRKVIRGNPLLAQGKFTTIEEINAKIDALRST